MGEIEPTAHTLTVKFTTNAQLDDSDAILANLTGTYTEELFPGDAYAFRFVPRVDGREFAAITVDGEEVLFDDTTDTAAWVIPARPSPFPLSWSISRSCASPSRLQKN